MLDVTFYKLPHGEKQIITMTEIDQEDADFFINKGYTVSMEELRTGQIVLYSPNGQYMDGVEADEEDEEIYIVPEGQGCREAMKELRKLVENPTDWSRE